MLGKRAQRAYLEHNSVNSRIILISLRGKYKNFKDIQVYAPDSSYEDEDVENFYSQLEEEIETIKTGDVVIVIGDFNSKIGNDRRGYEYVMGEFGLGERNERGQRMLEFSQGKQLCISKTYFYHREQHKYTWTHPDGIHKNCIDYILINKRWKSSVMGTKVMRGTDFGTSHELLLLNFRQTEEEIKNYSGIM
ncbi:craniofacial development protein 2-like [Palaemon carinicauda]|uniref:craniofacial development protein 2-like n=1 Tax=Palaemon carinicauda TaxID=392227 RepID=UPI0035B5AF60